MYALQEELNLAKTNSNFYVDRYASAAETLIEMKKTLDDTRIMWKDSLNARQKEIEALSCAKNELQGKFDELASSSQRSNDKIEALEVAINAQKSEHSSTDSMLSSALRDMKTYKEQAEEYQRESLELQCELELLRSQSAGERAQTEGKGERSKVDFF